MTKITIHDAFAKKKILEKRIPQKIADLRIIYAKKESSEKINGIELRDLKERINSDNQSLNDDIRLYRELTQKIYQSNAETKITVGKKEYTVLEALQIHKFVIPHEINMLNTITKQYENSKTTVEVRNEDLEEKADDFVQSLAGSDKSNVKDFAEQRELYIKQRRFDLFDPLNVANMIEQRQKELDDFVSNLDSALSVSNATTFIELEI